MAIPSRWYFVLYSNGVYMYFALFTWAYELRATKLSRLIFISCTYKFIAFSVECCLRYFIKRAGKLLYLRGRSMCRMTNAVSWDSFQNLCLAIKTMFSIWQVVCVFFVVYKKYTCSLPNERWYKLWLKIEVTCFSNSRCTGKIIFDISKQATWSRSSPSFSSVATSPSSVKTSVA